MKKIIIILLLIIPLSTFILSRYQKYTKILGKNTRITDIPVQIKSSTPTPTKIPSPTPFASITPTPLPTVTPTPRPVIAPLYLEDLFTKYAGQYNIDKDLLKRIAKCESSLNPNAATTRYAGLFQFSEILWVQTRNLMGENSDLSLRFNAEESIKTASFLVSQNHLGVWPNCNK